MIKINEIFFSIQGESSYVGFPTVFIRTSGCPLRCGYCDTAYAYYNGSMMAIDDILAEVAKHDAAYVCVTGGEPMAQANITTLLKRLCDAGYRVSLETSGALDCTDVDPRVRKILDVKTPGSGEEKSFNPVNLKFADKDSEFKFVICSEEDFHWAENFVAENDLFRRSNVLYSPAFKKVSETWLAENILKKKSSARLQLQLHKYIWSPHTKSV